MKPHSPSLRRTLSAHLYLLGLSLAVTGAATTNALAQPAQAPTADITATSDSSAQDIGNQIRAALGTHAQPKKKTPPVRKRAPAPSVTSQESPGTGTPRLSSQYLKAREAALSRHGTPSAAAKTGTAPAAADGHGQWAYDGDNGPQAWGQLRPDFHLCAAGTRQSPIAIDEGNTLQGPAEPIAFDYHPSEGTVVNNGHTIEVEVQGNNAITVRSASYRLTQFHFHTPSEEQINAKRYAMVAHLVHQNDAGQLAVVAVLLEPGEENPLVDKVWTYLPLDAGDRVRMPAGLLNLNALLPADQRYYQFMGSLTTPPCSEGVLWMVLKQPVSISPAQLRLFSQLYPHNARPVQDLNGRPVREAQ